MVVRAPIVAYTGFDAAPRTYDYKADRKIAAGGEVTILYGHFTPSAFLVDYGFTQDGDHPRSVLHVEPMRQVEKRREIWFYTGE